jgi:hypothetical protein
MVHEPDDVEPHLRPVGSRVVRLAAAAVAAGVEGDRAITLGERGEEAAADPLARRVRGVAVQEDHRLAGPVLDEADRDTGRVKHALPLESARRAGRHQDRRANHQGASGEKAQGGVLRWSRAVRREGSIGRRRAQAGGRPHRSGMAGAPP